MQLFDSHCHIQETIVEDGADSATMSRWQKAGCPSSEDIITSAKNAGVTKMICVGTSLSDSRLAVHFVQARKQCFASVGIHPHESSSHTKADHKQLDNLAGQPRVVAVGEIGLDYYYSHSSKADQRKALIAQLKIAEKHDLPVIFHVREAFDDFFAILSDFPTLEGVVHSFSSDNATLDKVLSRGLYVGLNGIMTFTKQPEQLAAAKAVPLDRMLLETDAPFLTPVPYRGKVCKPEHLLKTAEFLANLRNEALDDLARQTYKNTMNLFDIQ